MNDTHISRRGIPNDGGGGLIFLASRNETAALRHREAQYPTTVSGKQYLGVSSLPSNGNSCRRESWGVGSNKCDEITRSMHFGSAEKMGNLEVVFDNTERTSRHDNVIAAALLIRLQSRAKGGDGHRLLDRLQASILGCRFH